jgi:hypothetical protein
MAMTEHAVVIAGGGPTGLMLAGERQIGVVQEQLGSDSPKTRGAALVSRLVSFFANDAASSSAGA